MNPVDLSDIHSLAYAVLLCHYVYRDGLDDSEFSRRLTENGIPSSAAARGYRTRLTLEGLLTQSGEWGGGIHWHISPRGKTFVEKDLQLRYGPVRKKPAMNRLKSFLRSIGADGPF